jgi:hypothetical protein
MSLFRDRRAEGEPEAAWKREVLAACRRWLDALPDEAPPVGGDGTAPADAGAVGLVDLADAVAALGRETKALARSSEQSRRQLETFLASAASSPQPAAEAGPDWEALESQLRSRLLEQGRKERDALLLEMGEILDALRATHGELARRDAAPPPEPRGFLRRRASAPPRPPAAPALEVPLRKLADMLGRHGVTAIARVGDLYDAASMRVGSVSEAGRVPPGRVSAVIRQGYRMQGSLLQVAEVAVERENQS